MVSSSSSSSYLVRAVSKVHGIEHKQGLGGIMVHNLVNDSCENDEDDDDYEDADDEGWW